MWEVNATLSLAESLVKNHNFDCGMLWLLYVAVVPQIAESCRGSAGADAVRGVPFGELLEMLVLGWAHFCKIDGRVLARGIEIWDAGAVLGCCLGCCLRRW